MKYQTRISEVERLSNGILMVSFKDNIEMQTSDLDDLFEICMQEIGLGQQALFLNIFPESILGDFEFAKKSAHHELNQFRRAQALVVKNLPQRIQSGFYQSYFTLGYPMKVFNDEGLAVDWLLSQMSYETSIASIQKLDEELIKITTKKDVVINEKGLTENLEIYRKLLPNGGYFLTVFNDTNTADRTAKVPFESRERTDLKKGEAFVIRNLATRIELEYYINKTKQMYPTKVFEFEDEAIEFIQSLRAKP